MHFAGSPRYIGTFVSRSDAINASKMGQEYFATIPYDNLSPQQIEKLVISMRKSAYASFPNLSHTRITNAEEAKVNSLMQKTKAPPIQRTSSKNTGRDIKEASKKRKFEANNTCKIALEGVSLRPSGKYVSAGSKFSCLYL